PEAGNILLGIRWLLQNERASIRANPSIVALDGEEASIKVGTDQYFSIVTGSAAYAYSRLEQVSAAISLNIEPHIIPDTDEILCRLEPNVEDVVGKGEGGLPVITVRNAKSRLRLNNGEAIVIGGLTEEQETRRENKVPVLSEIPLVGNLFKSSSTTTGKREVVILIAPHILDEHGQFQGRLLSDILSGIMPQQ
ncbi:MAG: type II and III secretion system protein, partial [Armatimonadota bacterium]